MLFKLQNIIVLETSLYKSSGREYHARTIKVPLSRGS